MPPLCRGIELAQALKDANWGRVFKFLDPTGLPVLDFDPIQLVWMVSETAS